MKPIIIFKIFFFILIFQCDNTVSAQTIGTFTTVTPTVQTQSLVIPSTHTFQRLIKSGDVLSLGGTLGGNTDFTGYVPASGSSRNGYLSISSETTPAAVAILGISYNISSHLWTVNSGGNVPFSPADMGSTSRFCSGTVTPNGTVIVSEEAINTTDLNADGYDDVGWLIEINPVTRTVINQDGIGGTDKLWAIGKANHENAAIKTGNTVLFTGADDGTNGYLYKFVATVAGNFSSGLLYVLRTTSALGSGTWKLLPNTTQVQRNNTITAAAAAPAAYNFNGIEDVEIGPDGKIYFAAKSEGKIYRFIDNGTFGTASDISGLEVFAGNDAYPTIKNYDVDGPGSLPLEPWGRGNDNLAFDGDGNLWVLQDAIVALDRNHVWVIGPTHTQASPDVRVFATTPLGCEPTGITFTPDYKFMFISFMHPNTSNTISQTDAAGASVIFNTHTTVVVARVESLGSLATLPVNFTAFEARQSGVAVVINWTVTNISNHSYFSVERSTDGIGYEEIYRNNESLNGLAERSFNITDNNLPASSILFYRIKQCDVDGRCQYSNVKQVKLNGGHLLSLYPLPAKNRLGVKYFSTNSGKVIVTVHDVNGKTLTKETHEVVKGFQLFFVNTELLNSGVYLLQIADENMGNSTMKFVKMR